MSEAVQLYRTFVRVAKSMPVSRLSRKRRMVLCALLCSAVCGTVLCCTVCWFWRWCACLHVTIRRRRQHRLPLNCTRPLGLTPHAHRVRSVPSPAQDYNFRSYFLRRVKEDFRAGASLPAGSPEAQASLTRAHEELDVLRRQVTVNQLYHTQRSVMDAPMQ